MRTIPCIACLLAALLLLPGCSGLCGEEQLPLTAAEVAKFVDDNPAIMRATQEVIPNLSNMSYKDGVNAVIEARNAKLRELGWDFDRYMYVYHHFYDALAYENLRLATERLRREKGRAGSPAERRERLEQLEQKEATLRSMRENYESRYTVAERVLVHERLYDLANQFKGGVEAFQSDSWN